MNKQKLDYLKKKDEAPCFTNRESCSIMVSN